MSQYAIPGAIGALGLGLETAGSFGNNRDKIAPGLSKYTAQDWSQIAHQIAKNSLYGDQNMDMRNAPGYTPQMEELIAAARNAGQGEKAALDRYSSQLAGQRRGVADSQRSRGALAESQARAATEEAKGAYSGYGNEALGMNQQAFERVLADIEARQAASRIGRGYNTSDAMLAAGQRGEALYGKGRSDSEILMNRAGLVGGAIERGRGREMDVRRTTNAGLSDTENLGLQQEYGMLGPRMQAESAGFRMAAPYMQALYNTQLQYSNTDPYLYPDANARKWATGSVGQPPEVAFGQGLQQAAGYLFGQAGNRGTSGLSSQTPQTPAYGSPYGPFLEG